jgi:hypothetical protein
MANEINIQATLTLQKYSPALQGVGNLTITQTGTKCVSNVVNVGTGANSTIQIEGSTSIAYLFVKNLDSAAWDTGKYVEVALDNANPPTQIIARLRAGECCMIPVKPATAFYARATGATPDICYVAACA